MEDTTKPINIGVVQDEFGRVTFGTDREGLTPTQAIGILTVAIIQLADGQLQLGAFNAQKAAEAAKSGLWTPPAPGGIIT